MVETDKNSRPARILVIVPAHNESGSIVDVLADLASHAPDADVVVVDDASTDATADLARAGGATVLSLPCNLGVGGAVQTGYMYADRYGYDVAVQFDGDGQHRANLIAALMAEVAAGEADLVVGSRLVQGVRFRFAPLRYLGNQLLARLVSALVRRRITDPTSGFRAASRRAIRFFAENYPQAYLGDTVQALVWLSRQGMRISEVPARMRQRRQGRSAVGTLKGFWSTVRIILAVLVDCLEPPIPELQETDP